MSAPQHYAPPPQPPRRPVWRIVVGCLLLTLGALGILGLLASIAVDSYAPPEDPAEAIGALIGAGCCIGLPVITGILLLGLPARR